MAWPNLQGLLARGAGLLIAVGGAALCHVPWSAYYFGGGHQRHHRYTGSSRDVDRDAIFFLWEMLPDRGVVVRFCWLSFTAAAVPLAYATSLGLYMMYSLTANIKELIFAAVQ